VGIGSRGPVTEKIQKRFFEIVDGTAKDEFGWLLPVTSVREKVPVGA
jgi:branched-chain amino acid aminotransferase